MRRIALASAGAALAGIGLIATADMMEEDGNEAVAAAPPPAIAEPIGTGEPLPDLAGELRCGWLDVEGTWLVASANVGDDAQADALVRTGGRLNRLAGEGSGGFDALRRGGGFAGGDVTARVERGAGEPTGHEGSRHAATLILSRGGREERRDGWWECGP